MSRRPPSLRNAEYGMQQLARQNRSMIPGTAGGRLASASPIRSDGDVIPDETGFGGSEAENTSAVLFARDRFSLSSSTPTVSLTHTPADNSLHVYLNGLEQDETVDYTLTSADVAVLTAMGAGSGDVLDCRYAYVDATAGVPVTTTLGFASTGWKYLTVPQTSSDYATDGVEGSTTYADPTFNDSAWSTGQTPVGWGYGGGTGATPRNTTVAALSEVWLRRTLPGGGFDWQISVKVDNWGFLYFNGTRIDGVMPSGAIAGADGGSLLHGPYDIPQDLVRTDFNVVAFHVQDQAGGGGGSGYGPGDVLLADVSLSYVTYS